MRFIEQKGVPFNDAVLTLYQECLCMVLLYLGLVCFIMYVVRKSKTLAGKRRKECVENEDDPHKGNKTKATVSKSHAALFGKVERVKFKQSSMLQFLKKLSANEEPNEVSTQVSQPGQANQSPKEISQLNFVKLLTSDDAAVEFLTLCAIKVSKLDGVRNELNRMEETYLAISAEDDTDNFFDYPVPDLDILNCNM